MSVQILCLLKNLKEHFMCMRVLFAYMSVHPLLVWGPQRPQEDVRSLETGVTDSFDLPCGFWELNPGSLEG